MGLFNRNDKKEKKIRDAINMNKTKIMTMLSSIQISCKDQTAMQELRKIQAELSSQGETAEEKVLVIDAEIMQLLAEANKYILKGQNATATTKLSAAFSKCVDRHEFCMVGGAMTKEDRALQEQTKRIMDNVASATTKSRAEELQEQINEETAKLDSLNMQFEKLRQLNAANPNNFAILSQANSIKAQITATNTRLNNLSIELSKETSDVLLDEMQQQNETLVANRTISEEKSAVNRAKILAQNEERLATQQSINANNDLLGATMGGLGDPFAATAATNVFDPFGTTSGNASANVFGTQDVFGNASTAPSATQKSYGAFDASKMGTQDMARDIEKTMRELQTAMDAYNDKILDAQDDLNDYNAQLRPLLERRKNAAPSDCLVLDGQIDQVNAKRNSVVYKIKRYSQVLSQLADKKSLLDKLSTQQDLTATDANIAKITGGKFADFAGLAMFLNESVKESNEQLEEIGSAIAVAESEEVFTRSMAGASAALTDMSVTKDEDKYAALEQEIGVRRLG